MKRRRKLLGLGLGLGTLVAAGLGLRSMAFLPPDVLEEPIRCTADAPLLQPGTDIRLMSWNIQFAGGRAEEFFYDQGPRVHVPPTEVEDSLKRIALAIRTADPDIVLLQEVDRDSARTGRLDQLAWLIRELRYPCAVSTPYFRSTYVPHPPQEHLGRVDMHLVVLSKYRLDRATRHQLALLDESPIRRVFNLKRALLDVRLPLAGGGQLALLQTHLSAFSHNDGTLEKQVGQLHDHASSLSRQGIPWLLAGDFNSLPPGDDPSRLHDAERGLYDPERTPIQPLFDDFHTPVPAEDLRADLETWGTFIPFGHQGPDRTIDYLFSDRLETRDFRVVEGLGTVSDHLPLLTTVRVPASAR